MIIHKCLDKIWKATDVMWHSPGKRGTKWLLILLAALFILAISCNDDDDSGDGKAVEDDDDNNDDNDDDSQDDDDSSSQFCQKDQNEVEAILSKMTLREKIAQMYMVGVTTLPWFELSDAMRYIKEMGVGGVFAAPLTFIGFWPDWTAMNANWVQSLAMSRQNPIPLLIAGDQEGGIPQALCHLTGGTDQPGNMGLGASFDPDVTYQSYGIMGEQLNAVGINTDFAPVLGLMVSHEEVSMYTRCFGELTSEVKAHARAATLGLRENLVIATAKHFPSHSTAPGDEHLTLPVNTDDEATIRENYFPPFEAAIKAGADMIMTTHVVYQAWENGLPSTFSHRIFTEILREELGYEGVIVTDDMNMGSLTFGQWEDHPDVLAIQAGADLILDLGGDQEPPYGMSAHYRDNYAFDLAGQIDAVLDAVGDGRLSEDRIDESVRRLLLLKMKYCLFETPYVDETIANDVVGTADQIEASAEFHARAITVVRNDQGIWPLNPDPQSHIHVISPRSVLLEMYPGANWGTIAGSNLLKHVRDIIPTATGEQFGLYPNNFTINRIIANAENSGADYIVVGVYNALSDDRQTTLVKGLLALGIPTVVVALAMPYDLMAFPEATTYVATYSNRDLALETFAKALFGKVEATGRLPVSLPGLYDVGHRVNR